jgi:PIN domain nuclease of toxin-antitoxin system
MRVIIDTHVLIWAVDEPTNLTGTATNRLQDPANDLVVSAATIWEAATKVGVGKLTLSQPYRTWMNQALSDLGATILPITVDRADLQAGLPYHHRDLFDRLIIAQSLVEGIAIVSADGQFDAYGVNRLW